MFETDIAKLAAAGITKGCNPPDNTHYCPDAVVTRGQMAAFLVRALNLTDDGGGNTFTDDNGTVFETDIAKLAAAGITKGCNPPTNDHYCPNDPVHRDQMASFLGRALNLTPTTPPEPVPGSVAMCGYYTLAESFAPDIVRAAATTVTAPGAGSEPDVVVELSDPVGDGYWTWTATITVQVGATSLLTTDFELYGVGGPDNPPTTMVARRDLTGDGQSDVVVCTYDVQGNWAIADVFVFSDHSGHWAEVIHERRDDGGSPLWAMARSSSQTLANSSQALARSTRSTGTGGRGINST